MLPLVVALSGLVPEFIQRDNDLRPIRFMHIGRVMAPLEGGGDYVSFTDPKREDEKSVRSGLYLKTYFRNTIGECIFQLV